MFYNVHCHHTHNNQNEMLISNVFADEPVPEQVFFSAGFHPWQTITDNTEYYQLYLTEKLQHNRCLALGESGLDKAKGASWQTQVYRFKTQLQIAKPYSKPVIVHCVRAYYEVLSVLNQVKWDIPFIFHGFNKSYNLAKELIHKGAYLSFGTALFKLKFMQEVFLPLWHVYPMQILLETDIHQIPVQKIYQAVADNTQISITEVEQVIGNTFNNVFNVV